MTRAVAAPGVRSVHSPSTTRPLHLVALKYASMPISKHNPVRRLIAAPEQFSFKKKVIVPSHRAVFVQVHAAHERSTSSPTRCLFGAVAGQATSPGAVTHVFDDPGGEHIAGAHESTVGAQMRARWLVTFARSAIPGALHVATG